MSALDFLSGLTIHQIRVGYDLRLVVSDAKWLDENDAEVVIEEPCLVTYPDGSEHQVQITDPESIPPLLAAQARLIVEASAQDGALRIVLDDGRKILIPPNDEYEAWRIEGPGENLIVCGPGGGLASIDDDDGVDQEHHTFAPGEAESSGTVTLPNGVELGPNMVVESEGRRREV